MTQTQPQGFLAVPPAGNGPGVLVLHAWWGLNDTMKAFCTRLAETGFAAFAPDLYHGKVADNIADAEALGKALDTIHLQADEYEPQSWTSLRAPAPRKSDQCRPRGGASVCSVSTAVIRNFARAIDLDSRLLVSFFARPA